MPRYDFVSPGAAAGSAIQQFLAQRQMLERQAQLDALAKQQQEAEIAARNEQLAIQRQEEQRLASIQTQQLEDASDRAAAQRAANIYKTAVPGVVDAATADLLSKYGYGGIVEQSPSYTQGAETGEAPDMPGVPLYDVQRGPDTYRLTGGSDWQSARTAAEERKAAAEAARAAADERARQDRLSREQIAALAAAGRGQNADLQRDILGLRADALREQAESKKAATERARSAEQEYAAGIIGELNRLTTPTTSADGKATAYQLSDGAQAAVGSMRAGYMATMPIVGGLFGGAADAQAAIQSLVAKLDIDQIRQLKAQSRTGATGFGQLSEGELKILENASSQLATSQSEPVFLDRLNKIRAVVEKVLRFQPPSASVGSGSGGNDLGKDF